MSRYQNDDEKNAAKEKLEAEQKAAAAELSFEIAKGLREKRIVLQRLGDGASRYLASRLERAAQTIEAFGLRDGD